MRGSQGLWVVPPGHRSGQQNPGKVEQLTTLVLGQHRHQVKMWGPSVKYKKSRGYSRALNPLSIGSTIKMYSFSNFEVYNTLLFTIITMLCFRSLGLNYLLVASLYL